MLKVANSVQEEFLLYTLFQPMFCQVPYQLIHANGDCFPYTHRMHYSIFKLGRMVLRIACTLYKMYTFIKPFASNFCITNRHPIKLISSIQMFRQEQIVTSLQLAAKSTRCVRLLLAGHPFQPKFA